ncbi:hypothetical protein Dimus_017045 [Dionaea muscipula]
MAGSKITSVVLSASPLQLLLFSSSPLLLFPARDPWLQHGVDLPLEAREPSASRLDEGAEVRFEIEDGVEGSVLASLEPELAEEHGGSPSDQSSDFDLGTTCQSLLSDFDDFLIIF